MNTVKWVVASVSNHKSFQGAFLIGQWFNEKGHLRRGRLRKPAKYGELEKPSCLELQLSASYNLVLKFLLVHLWLLTCRHSRLHLRCKVLLPLHPLRAEEAFHVPLIALKSRSLRGLPCSWLPRCRQMWHECPTPKRAHQTLLSLKRFCAELYEVNCGPLLCFVRPQTWK